MASTQDGGDNSTATAGEEWKDVKVGKGGEYRFEVEEPHTVSIKLKSGSAEVFGVELAMESRQYNFVGPCKVAVFTWYGCCLQTTGVSSVSYVSEETPMTSYINVHAQLEAKREAASGNRSTGPRVLICGPSDSGKSSIARILLNYAIRLGRKPTYVDLDVGQNSLTAPGALAATPLDRNCLTIDGSASFVLTTPLIYYYGHNSPNVNTELYKVLVQNLASSVKQRMQNDADVSSSGVVINTCGWVDGAGYKLLLETIKALEADTVLVIGQDRLYSELTRDTADSSDCKVVKLERSGGVVPRSSSVRRKDRMRRIREYFYGPKSAAVLSPAAIELDFNDVFVFSIVDMQLSDVMLPVGQASMQRLQVQEVDITAELKHSLVAILYGKSDTNDNTAEEKDHSFLMNSCSAGFLYIKEVDVENKKIQVLSPCPGALPSKYLCVGTIKWME